MTFLVSYLESGHKSRWIIILISYLLFPGLQIRRVSQPPSAGICCLSFLEKKYVFCFVFEAQVTLAERNRLMTLRETLASLRRTISAAKLQSNRSSSSSSSSSSSPPLSPSPPFRDGEILSTLSLTIARARSGLVQELVEVFNVVEVGGRPPIGGKAGTKGEWTIGDLILPVPGDMRRNKPFSPSLSLALFSTLNVA